mgnify:CR=1 FL=1
MLKKIALSLIVASSLFASEKIFVVERESSSIAVIENDKFKNRMENFRNMNHAVVKFYKDEAYAISRDGYVIKFDPKKEIIEAEYKTSKIGRASCRERVSSPV